MEEPKKINCPVCKESFSLEEQMGDEDVTFCPNCDAELEVTNAKKPRVIVEDEGGFEDDMSDDYEDYDSLEEEEEDIF